MAPENVRVLFVEDVPEDFELEQLALRRDGLALTALRVETREQLVEALDAFRPDIVISDYNLPRLDGLTALSIVREKTQALPFVFCSGTIGEERAIESLKNGATDYVLKDHLGSFAQRIRRALSDAKERAAHRRVEEQLIQAQKMEAVGRLAGGVAHDFNNLLTVINGFSELALLELPAGSVRSNIEEVLKAGERAAGLTRQLLAFSRKQALSPQVLNLNKTVSDTERMLRRLIGEDVRLVTGLDSALGNVRADPGQVEQVIVNLAINARDAMPHGGTLTLETANVLLDEHYASLHAGSQPGLHVMLAVSDTGIGMDKETQSHLFEPFFTTKELGKGTGLGLSTIYGIVKQSRGSIWVYSELGKGTTFKVYLPRVDLIAAESAPTASAPLGTRGSESVLVVEDSESVRRLVTETLSRNGYTVVAASEGEEALGLLAKLPSLDLLITDVVLPGMSGPEIAYKITKQRPDTKVLFTSGYTDRGIVESGILESGIPFLQKPFGPESLALKVREVLEAAVK